MINRPFHENNLDTAEVNSDLAEYTQRESFNLNIDIALLIR